MFRSQRDCGAGRLLGAALLLGSACTTLGPMPATTGLSALPAARPEVEAQTGFVPGYYLSNSVEETRHSAELPQISGLFEPDRWLGLPGLIVGARYAGEADTQPSLEPFAGYRAFVDGEHRFALGGVAYATHASGTHNSASYSATRGGAEALADLRATPSSRWFELHLTLAAAFTALSANGSYCQDDAGRFGVDCPTPPTNRVSADVGGLYPSATGAIAIDFARHLQSAFHGGRVTLGGAIGAMPSVVGADQKNARAYGALELLLSLGLGGT